MKITGIDNLRKAALATVATAALLTGTAACGSKSDDSTSSTPDELIAAIAERASDIANSRAITGVQSAADDTLAASTQDLQSSAPVSAPTPTNAPSASAAPSNGTATPASSIDDISSNDVAAPANTSANTSADTPADTPVIAATDGASAPTTNTGSAATSVTLPGGVSSGSSLGSLLPNYGLVPTPEILVYTFQQNGTKVNARVFVNAKSNDALATIDAVNISYTTRNSTGLYLPITKSAVLVSTAGTGCVWGIDNLGLANGDMVTITATNKGGRTVSVTVKVAIINS